MSTSSQTWDPKSYAENARFVADLGAPVIALLAPQPGERILDLGCGDGALTEKLVATGCNVLAVDASAEQVSGARARGLDAQVADASCLVFENEFHGVFSNAVLHWIKTPDAMLRGVHRALRPGGRFVAEMGGAGCVAAIVSALENELDKRGMEGRNYNPWYFPAPADYRRHLEAAGFEIEQMELFPRPTRLPGDVIGWLTTFAQNFMAPLAPAHRPAYLESVRIALENQLRGDDGVWTADYVRLRFRARKPGEPTSLVHGPATI